MTTYIMLIRYTQKGIEKIKESPSRLDVAKKAFKAAGAELKEFYLVTGRYDIVVVAEAPNDETIAKCALVSHRRAALRQRRFAPLKRMNTGRSLLLFHEQDITQLRSETPERAPYTSTPDKMSFQKSLSPLSPRFVPLAGSELEQGIRNMRLHSLQYALFEGMACIGEWVHHE